MHIASFRIENYKSFRDTGEVRLSRGFNVAVGRNNVGKTALVQALSLSFVQQQHRSLRTVPVRTTPVPGNSKVQVFLELSRDEVSQYLTRLNNFWVPVGGGRRPAEYAQALAEGIKDANTLATVWHGGALAGAQFVGLQVGSSGSPSVLMRLTPGGSIEPAQDGLSGVAENNRFEWQIAELIKKERMYAFDAERLHIGISRAGPTTVLRPDASNLPEVLENLQGRNPARFARLGSYVRTIFPGVRGISVTPREGDNVEILIWTIDPATEREDLAVRLEDSGTGIGQVVALLYVALEANSPQVILIDEPQSFLHPGAVRKLIEILQDLPLHHQFVITTHSPTAVTAADPDVLLLLRLQEAETVIQRLEVTESQDLRVFLAEVGARLSDVFGADNILWVEGHTEELCFPKIVRRLNEQPLLGTAVVGVMHTADFEARRTEATIELYNRLSAGRGLLPAAVGFIFDRESRTGQDRQDMERRGNVFFLPRRMYENYLLSPPAIAAVASRIKGFREEPLTEVEIRAWLEHNRWNGRYFDPPPVERTSAVWLREVRGDRLLGDLFRQLSEQRVQYDKVRHGVALTDWLLEHAPEELRELSELIARALAPRAV